MFTGPSARRILMITAARLTPKWRTGCCFVEARRWSVSSVQDQHGGGSATEQLGLGGLHAWRLCTLVHLIRCVIPGATSAARAKRFGHICSLTVAGRKADLQSPMLAMDKTQWLPPAGRTQCRSCSPLGNRSQTKCSVSCRFPITLDMILFFIAPHWTHVLYVVFNFYARKTRWLPTSGRMMCQLHWQSSDWKCSRRCWKMADGKADSADLEMAQQSESLVSILTPICV